MLNERQLNALPERIYENLNKMNSDYLQKIGEVIKEIGELRPSDVHKLQKLHEYGSTGLAEELARITEKNVKEIYDIFDLVAQDNYAYAEPFYKASGINYVPYSENEELKIYTRLIAKQTADEYINFTQTTAFAVFDKTGGSIAPLFAAEKDKMKTTLSDTYIKLVDYAAGQVQMGAESYQSTMRDVIKAMADSGIRTVDYATGFSKRLDSAVRQNILWGVKQYNQQSAELIGEDFGADGYEIPYHSNPRPTHAEMGGRMYAKGEAVRIKGVFYPSIKTVEPLLNDYGCLHYKIPVILGVSQPAYSERELETLKEKDNRTFEFEGKKYTGYEAKQMQRQIETAIRKQKDLSIIAGAAGEKDLQLQAQEKLNLLAGKYAKFSKAADLPTRIERLRVEGFKSVKIPQKSLTNAGKGGIIKAEALSRYVNSSEALYEYAKKIERINGYEDMIIHGDKYGFEIRDKNGNIAESYTVREFAKILKRDPNYKGGNIRLISCETGADDTGAAQMLANQLGVNVLAPTDVLWVRPDGTIIIGPTEFENTGHWKLFKPKR